MAEPASTCRMVVDDMSVVDHAGRVRGLENIRIIDALIMPHVASGNLNCPTMMLAEKLVDHVQGKPALQPESPTASSPE